MQSFLFILLTLLAVVSLKVQAAAPEYRLVKAVATCVGDVSCPEQSSGQLTLLYGRKKEQIKGIFKVEYRPQGDISIQVTAETSSKNPLKKTTIQLGSSTGSACVATEAVLPLTVRFDQCDFQQEFRGHIVHRKIVVKVRQHFQTGEIVDFIGYRDVQVDFYLTLVNPSDVIVTPQIPQIPHTDLDVCNELKHKITALPSLDALTWRFSVEADGYDPEKIGYGFKIQSCILKPYIGGNISQNPDHHRQIITAGVIANSALHVSHTTYPVIPPSAAGLGTIYELVIGQTWVVAEGIRDLHAPQISCEVCICKLNSLGGDKCPTELQVDGSRSAFRELPTNLLRQNSRLEAGPVRLVSPPKPQSKK